MQPEMSTLGITKKERMRSGFGIFAKEKYLSIAIAN